MQSWMNRTERNCLFFAAWATDCAPPTESGRGEAAQRRTGRFAPEGSRVRPICPSTFERASSLTSRCAQCMGAPVSAPPFGPPIIRPPGGGNKGQLPRRWGCVRAEFWAFGAEKRPLPWGGCGEKRRLTTAVGKGKLKTKLHAANRWARRAVKGREGGRKDPGKGAMRGAADSGKAALPAHFERGRAAALGRPGAAAGGHPGQRRPDAAGPGGRRSGDPAGGAALPASHRRAGGPGAGGALLTGGGVPLPPPRPLAPGGAGPRAGQPLKPGF